MPFKKNKQTFKIKKKKQQRLRLYREKNKLIKLQDIRYFVRVISLKT